MSEQKLFSFRNPWFSASIGVTGGIAVLAAFAGLIWLPLAQADLKLSGIWDAICSAAGVPRASPQGTAIAPDFKTSNVVMTSEMLTRLDQVSIGRGATLAQRCAICHGPRLCGSPTPAAPISRKPACPKSTATAFRPCWSWRTAARATSSCIA